jgi:hypothetical protein
MFEITPSVEFSAWFESLSPELAEEVACALDLLAEAGVALGPSRTSRALLWYDGCGGEGSSDPLFPRHTTASMLQSFDDVRGLLLWHREVVRCLGSSAFRERLARLSPQAASVALVAVENLKVRVKAASTRIALEQHSPKPKPKPKPVALPLSALSVLSAREALVLEQRFDLANELKEAFFEVLQLVGLEPSQVMNSPSGLCELSIPSTEPPLRVLFGLDAPGQRIVALLGEPLTRKYYGDSVQLAEQRWLHYCSSPPQPSASASEP